MSQKEKYLSSAQKFIAKGQLDRAIKDYEQAVALDPQDLRCRQKLAELLVKANRKDDAIREFETIGKYYADNGYFLKAIAVYKQMQKVDPQNMDITVALGDLNEKQGLKGNALAEYRTAVEFHQRAGNLTEAGKALDRMMAVDEGNVSIQIKKAEILHAGHLTEKAYQEYVAAGVMLSGSGDEAGFRDLIDRMARLFPERNDFLTEVARGFLEGGRPDDSLRILDATVASGKATQQDWELLLDSCKAAGDLEKRKEKAREMAALFPRSVQVRERLLEALADLGEIDEGVKLLDAALKDFPDADWSQIESLYRVLLEKDPANIHLLTGLKDLYARAGKRSKVTDVETRIALLSGENAAAAVQPGPAAEEEQPSVAAPAIGWDSELDLALVSPEEPGPGIEPDSEHPEQGTWEDTRPTLDISGSAESMEVGGDFDLDLPDPEAAAGSERGLEIELPEISLSELDFDLGSPAEPPAPAEEPVGDEPGEGGEEASDDESFHYLDLGDDFDVEPAAQDAAGTLPLPGEEELPLLDEIEELAEEHLEEIPWEEAGVSGAPSDECLSVADIVAGLAAEAGRADSDEDTETHFNLGIAYMEMGLYDEAVAEFLSSSSDPRRQVASVSLAATCFRDKGDAARAEQLFSSLLAASGVSAEEEVTLRYEYGLLLEREGRSAEAADEFVRVREADPRYRDVAAKIAALQGGGTPAELAELELLDEDLEEFL